MPAMDASPPSSALLQVLHPADRDLVRPGDAFVTATSAVLQRDGSLLAEYECPRSGEAKQARVREGKPYERLWDTGVWVVVPDKCHLARQWN